MFAGEIDISSGSLRLQREEAGGIVFSASPSVWALVIRLFFLYIYIYIYIYFFFYKSQAFHVV